MRDDRAHQPYARLVGGPYDQAILAEVDLTAANLDGYRRSADVVDYVVTGPRGGAKTYKLRIWKYVLG